MNARFRVEVERLDQKLNRLLTGPSAKLGSLPTNMPKRGVYLLSKGTRHLYVGRSNRLRERLQEHGRASSDHSSASFAFLIARRRTGRKRATYKKQWSRAHLSMLPKFKGAFARARQRVAKMDARWVAEPRQVRQALLEIYVATVLHTPYNEFDTY